MNAQESYTDIKCERRIFTQEDVNEEIKTYIALLTRQLLNLTRLIEGLSTARRPYLSLLASTSASSTAAGPSPDTSKKLALHKKSSSQVPLFFVNFENISSKRNL